MKARAAAGNPEIESVARSLAAVLRASPLLDFAFGHGSFFEGLPYHDVDVAVRESGQGGSDLRALADLAARCEAAIHRPVDLHSLEGPSPGFRRAATAGRLLWARDRHAAWAYAELLQRMAWDWRPVQDQIIRDLARPVEGTRSP